MHHRVAAVAACLLSCWPAPAAGPLAILDVKDRQIVAKFAGHAANVPKRITAEYCRKLAADSSEGYCWLILPQLQMPLTAYQITGEAKHLDAFVATFANMRAAMTKGPDGYLGWYGKALGLFRDPKDPDRKVDVIITGFRTVDVLCRFLEAVAADEAMGTKFAAQTAEYLDLMENHLVRKWRARGRLVELGGTGAVFRTHGALRDVKGNLTQPHNKHSIICRALLGLYRVTGRDEHMKTAIRLGTRFKRCLTLRDGHYEWNYWDPAGAWDVHPADGRRWKHWIGPEHRSGYYSASLTQAVMLYHHGVVFDRTDIDRFLKTQLEVTWNGRLAAPKWYRVDRSRGRQSGSYICGALAPFHEKIHRFLYTGPRQDERLARMDHSWQGGPVAQEWLHGKLVYCPAAAGGKRIHGDFGKRFLRKAENRTFLESLRFTVTGSGYRPPRSPADMKPMPKA